MSTTLAKPNLLKLLGPYRGWIVLLVVLTIAANSLNLAVPKIIATAIDDYGNGTFMLTGVLILFAIVAAGIFIFTYLQSIVQVYTSERVAKDLRSDLVAKISLQSYIYIQKVTPAKLLTNVTSDVDAVKSFVSQAIASIISSLFLIVGASVLLIITNWRLALAVLIIIPIIAGTFYVVLGRVRKLFVKTQEAIDWLNNIINESILGAALIRLVNAQQIEYAKFIQANTEARNIGLSILRLFATLIPVITFSTNLATLIILALGGHFVISDTMTLGDFTAFTSYLSILVFPILIIGFMSNVIAQASASYQRISVVLNAPRAEDSGTVTDDIKGDVALKNITMKYGEKTVLKDVSFSIPAGTKTAIIGPTAAGKTQLLYLLTGLLDPLSGTVEYDGKNIDAYDKQAIHSQVGFVFQDSILFNLSLRENIAFSAEATDADLEKAIATAELSDFIKTLPKGLETIVSERGTSLSGGQKQRIMLARALSLNPKVLFLDDFIARVDAKTERKILENVAKNYPDITLISVSQKIASIEHYDQIVVLMEGELVAQGTHAELMKSSPDYVQIYNSQQSINSYELQA